MDIDNLNVDVLAVMHNKLPGEGGSMAEGAQSE